MNHLVNTSMCVDLLTIVAICSTKRGLITYCHVIRTIESTLSFDLFFVCFLFNFCWFVTINAHILNMHLHYLACILHLHMHDQYTSFTEFAHRVFAVTRWWDNYISLHSLSLKLRNVCTLFSIPNWLLDQIHVHLFNMWVSEKTFSSHVIWWKVMIIL